MKAKFLKIAKVKDEKSFYKKYPTEAAFFKAHPEAKSIKTAQTGLQTDANANGIPDYLEMNPPSQMVGPRNQWNFGNNIPNAASFNAPNVGQMVGNTFQPSGNSFGTPNYGQQWGQQNPIPVNNPNSQFSNGVFGGNSQKSNEGSTPFDLQGPMKVFNGINEGYKNLQKEKKETEKLETWANVTDVLKKAGISNAYAEKPKNKWFRPDDQMFIHNSSELNNTQGRGTDVLSSQNGSMIGGNPTEVQNTYSSEHTLFDDLGYEPLEDSQQIKAYQGGGSWFSQVNNALGGNSTGGFTGNIGQGSPLDSFVAGQFGNNAGSQLGGSIGSIAGPLGSLVGTTVGGYLDKEQGKQAFRQGRINENTDFLNRLDYTKGVTSGLSSIGVGENGANLDGGWVSNDWTPQVIATFGEHNMKDLLKPPHDAEMLRAGGHLREYTPPSERSMQTYENGGQISSYAMGGQLKTHWGGHLETMAHNPYLPGSGEITMLRGASHDNGGIGISYGGSENGYGEMAANGAEMGAQIEAESGEPMIEMANGGSVDPNTGKPSTEAVVFGNIPFTKKLAQATGDEDLIDLAKHHDGSTYKKIIEKLAAPQNKANKTKIKAAELASNADQTKWGKLILNTSEAMEKGADVTLKNYADKTMKLARLQNATQDFKKEVSFAKGKNISAEALGKGNIETDYDPITKDAEIENPYAKSGAFLRKAQGGDTTSFNVNSAPTSEGTPRITEDVYNKLVKLYDQGKRDKKSPAIKEFQHLYHQYFPKEAIGAIQKTTKEKGITNKAKQMGLTKEEILSGKNTDKILESNEDEFFGPRTEQYMANINADFNKTPKAKDLQLTTLGTPTKTTSPDKTQIGVVPYKRNKLIDVANMISPLFRKDNLPPLDPRQLAGEYMVMAQNQYEPVQSQRFPVQLDPLTRVSYQEGRDATTADFREVEKQLGGNTAALASLYGKKFLSNQPGYAEEFRTNQGLENQIYGGNRAKVNQNIAANMQLDAAQRDLQEKAKSITKQTQQEAVGSIADKYLQHQAREDEYKVKRNLFPQFGYDQGYGIHNQGPWYQPNIPQVYGGKETIKEVPVYGKNGKIEYYKMEENNSDETPNKPNAATPSIVGKNGKSITKNNRNSSVVKAYKNL